MARLASIDMLWKRWRRPTVRLGRWAAYVAAVVLVLLVALLVAVHVWLPRIANRKDEIANYISQRSSYHVQIDHSDAYWHGLNPGLRVYGLVVYSPGGKQTAVRFKEVRITLAWLPLLTGQVEINSLMLVHPSLSFERLADGSFRITGLDAVEQNIPGQEEGFLPWLFQQNDVAVEDGEMQWVDHTSAEPPLRLSRVNLRLRNNDDRHRLQLNADFPADMCQACSVVADVTGDPLTQSNWDGEIDVKAEGLNTYALPKIVREKLPAGFDGRFNVHLSSEWEDGVPMSVHGYAGVAALKLALSGIAPFNVNSAAADVTWTASSGGESWRLDLDRARLGLVLSPWFADKLRIEHHPDRNLLFVKHVNVNDLNAFLSGLKDNNQSLKILRAIHLGGVVDNLKIQLSTKSAETSGYSVEGDMRGLRFNPDGKLPGMSGLTGHISFGAAGGELLLDSQNGWVSLPRIFQNKIGFRSARGRIVWQRDADAWRVHGEGLTVVANDGKLWGDLDLRLPDDPVSSPLLKLRIDFSDGNGAHAARYYPILLQPGLRQWLQRSVVSGTVTSGHVIISGALNDFPFRDGNGRFEAMAHVRDGVFQYLPGWPNIRNIDADLLFSGAGLSVTGRSGTIRGLSVGRVVVTVDDLAAPSGAIVRAGGQVAGPVDQTLAVLYDSDIQGWSQFLVPGIRASGQGLLSLDLTIPARSPADAELDGLYEFHNAALYSPLRGVSLESVDGALEFNRHGLSGGTVQGKLLGGDASLAVVTAVGPRSTAGAVTLRAQGAITDAGLQRALGSTLGDRLTGDIPWTALLQMSRAGSSLDLIMDLQQLGIRLPAPLDKPSGVAAKLVVKTRDIAPDSRMLDLNVNNQLSGRFAMHKSGSGRWSFSRGAIEIGDRSATLPEASGLRVGVHTPGLDADRWWRVIKEVSSSGSSPGVPDLITEVDVNIGGLYLFGRRFGSFAMTLGKTAQGWHGQLSGDAVSGSLDVTSKADVSAPAQPLGPPPVLPTIPAAMEPMFLSGRSAAHQGSKVATVDGQRHAIYLSLQKLTIPEQTPTTAGGRMADVDPRSLPELHVRAQSFHAWGKAFGVLEVDALPTESGWHIQTFHVAQPNLDLRASGDWQVTPTGDQLTSIQTHINSDDFGRVLDAFGYPGELAQGKLQASGQWTWAGSPMNFSTLRLNGNGMFSLANGRLPHVSPGGAGRLLGLIDTRALTRYLALDFSNVFGKGFTFDNIRAQVTVENGNAYTQNLTVKSPSANIGVTGRLGLATHDMDLDISVVPRLSDQLTMTGILLGGPVIGAAVAVASDILKRPLEQSTRIQYAVKGSWDNPNVSKVNRPMSLGLLPGK